MTFFKVTTTVHDHLGYRTKAWYDAVRIALEWINDYDTVTISKIPDIQAEKEMAQYERELDKELAV